MTRKTTEIWCCDLCPAQAPAGAEGWIDASLTHGCPEHAEIVDAHRPELLHETRGRGSKERTTWWVACSCQTWKSSWERDSYRIGALAHKAHLVTTWGVPA